jgi:hypothetical protein
VIICFRRLAKIKLDVLQHTGKLPVLGGIRNRTDLQWSQGWFLGFIAMILTKSKTSFWHITMVFKKLKESNTCHKTTSSFMKTVGSLRILK